MADEVKRVRYKVLVGIDYPPGKRAEAGDVVDDIPATSLRWLVEGGIVEAVGAGTEKGADVASTPRPVPVPADGGIH